MQQKMQSLCARTLQLTLGVEENRRNKISKKTPSNNYEFQLQILRSMCEKKMLQITYVPQPLEVQTIRGGDNLYKQNYQKCFVLLLTFMFCWTFLYWKEQKTDWQKKNHFGKFMNIFNSIRKMVEGKKHFSYHHVT